MGRRPGISLLVLALGGCGFHPLYGERGPLDYNPALASIDVKPAADRIGQIVTEEVRNELNPRGIDVAKRYVLTLAISERRYDLGINRANTSSRTELLLDANLNLAPAGGKPAVFHDNVHTVTGFDLAVDAYAAAVAEEKAREEAAHELGRDIALRVDLFLKRETSGGS